MVKKYYKLPVRKGGKNEKYPKNRYWEQDPA